MIRLVASDIDGTIVGENNKITIQNRKAIQDMKKSNIDFTICTGKPYAMVKNFCQDLQANYGIFGNGNQIVDLKSGKEIYRKTLSQEEIEICHSLAKKENLHIHLYTENEVITPELLYMDLRNFILKDSIFPNDLNFKIVSNLEEYIEKEQPTVFKLIISSPSNLARLQDELNQKLDVTIYRVKKSKQYKDRIINKEYEYLDISPRNVTKGSALQALSSHLNLEKDDILSIGDNLNDIDMFHASGIGAAVNNAYDEVKKVANYTTFTSAEDGGFAEAIYKFIPFG